MPWKGGRTPAGFRDDLPLAGAEQEIEPVGRVFGEIQLVFVSFDTQVDNGNASGWWVFAVTHRATSLYRPIKSAPAAFRPYLLNKSTI